MSAIFSAIKAKQHAQATTREEEVADNLTRNNDPTPQPSPSSNSNAVSASAANANSPGSDPSDGDDDESTAAENGPQKASGNIVHTNVSS